MSEVTKCQKKTKCLLGEKKDSRGGEEALKRFFTMRKTKENIRKVAALWMQSVANAELVFYYHYYFTWQKLLSMTLVLFICHILPFL